MKLAKSDDKRAVSNMISNLYIIRMAIFADSFNRYVHIKLHKRVNWINLFTLIPLISGGDQTPSELSRRIFRSNLSMTIVFDDLEKRGFIRRFRSSRDHRKIMLKITEKGLNHVKETFKLLEKDENDIENLMDADDLKVLVTLMRSLRYKLSLPNPTLKYK